MSNIENRRAPDDARRHAAPPPAPSTPPNPRTSAEGAPSAALRFLPGRWIDGWDPENALQWQAEGRAIARRNLVFSIFAEFLGFAVWALWSICVPKLKAAGFHLNVDQMFWLVSIPSLVGATLRIPYTFAVPRFGGRNWTVISALLLLMPSAGLIYAVHHPELGFSTLMCLAALAGFGGGNFSSSMTNINFFYPEKEKGRALGLNAAGGNIGTAAVQFAVPLIIVAGAGVQLDRAGLMFIPLVILAAACAYFFMNSLTTAKTDARSLGRAAREGHTWVLSFIYIGTFGSFIGYSGAFPTLLAKQFPHMTLSIAFMGALVGSLSRPVGGMLSDKLGGARVTVISFVAMMAGAYGAILGLQQKSFPMFFGSFLWLFVFTGVGNGSIYRMIPAVFMAKAGDTDRLAAKKIAAGAIGLAGCVGAYGGFIIPRIFATSQNHTANHSIIPAIWIFIATYAVMAAVTWFTYMRKSSVMGAHNV